jgi:hypothetical protein
MFFWNINYRRQHGFAVKNEMNSLSPHNGNNDQRPAARHNVNLSRSTRNASSLTYTSISYKYIASSSRLWSPAKHCGPQPDQENCLSSYSYDHHKVSTRFVLLDNTIPDGVWLSDTAESHSFSSAQSRGVDETWRFD